MKLQGEVLNKKRNKTLCVVVTKMKKHPVYKKVISTKKKYHVHNPENKFNVGDKVTIKSCRPYSKTKTWEVSL